MNLSLRRNSFTPDGVFGILFDEKNNQIAVTLEHAFDRNEPKLPPGQYLCVRGMHQLPGMAVPFETFEIMNVPGHTGILFHVGNTNKDSNGCVLLGTEFGDTYITRSRLAFAKFMNLQDYIDQFQLSVS